MEDYSNVQPKFGTAEYVAAYIYQWGFPPMAGAESEGGAPASDNGAGDGGQGESNNDGSGLYDLDTVDPAYRDDVERIAKEMEGNATRKFQEHSDYRDRWSPYEELGLDQVPIEDVSNLLAFAEIANDEEAFKQWWNNVGEEYGFLSDDSSLVIEDGSSSFDDDEVSDEEIAQNLSEVFESMLEERLAPFEAEARDRQEAQMIQEVEDSITQSFEKLHEDHGDFDDDIVTRFALAYPGDEDAIDKGFADYQRLIGDTQRDTVSSKARSNKTVNIPGSPNTQASAPTSFEEAGAALRERLNA